MILAFTIGSALATAILIIFIVATVEATVSEARKRNLLPPDPQFEETKRLREANARAEALLGQLLGKKNLESFRHYGFVEVRGSITKRPYLVTAHLVALPLSSAQETYRGGIDYLYERRWCVFAREQHLPPADQVLSLALTLMANEARVRSIGNPF